MIQRAAWPERVVRSDNYQHQTGDAGIPWGRMDILALPLTQRCRKLSGGQANPSAGISAPSVSRVALLYPPLTDAVSAIVAFAGRIKERCSSTARALGAITSPTTGSWPCWRGAASATIGLYAGRPANQSGSLLIAARRGMHVASEVIDDWTPSGNVVDGPALQWLSQAEGSQSFGV